jgi:hypothetical protein
MSNLEKIEKHFDIIISEHWDENCVHFFYTTESADGYELYVSTSNANGKLRNNLVNLNDVYYYDSDLKDELKNVIKNLEKKSKIFILDTELEWVDDAFYELCVEIGN